MAQKRAILPFAIMKKFREKVKNHRIFGIAVQAVGVTLLAYVLSELMLQPFSFSANSVFSPEDSSDFMITDFFHIVADNRPINGTYYTDNVGEKYYISDPTNIGAPTGVPQNAFRTVAPVIDFTMPY